jgi:Flp pilus assembly pilin Flp
MWREEQGVLSFEWVMIITLLVIGTVGALSGVRDAVNSELSDVAGATVVLDQSYKVEVSKKYKLGTPFEFKDTEKYFEVKRQDGTARQTITNLNCAEQP